MVEPPYGIMWIALGQETIALEKAKRNAESAREKEAIAIKADRMTKLALEIAQKEKQKADSLRNITKVSTLAAAAILQAQLGNDTLGVLLARQAYNFNQQNPGALANQEIYEALRKSLNALPSTVQANEIGGPRMMRRHDDWARVAVYSPGGNLIASGSGNGAIYLWNPKQDTLYELKGHKAGVRALAFSPSGDTLASGSDDKTVRL